MKKLIVIGATAAVLSVGAVSNAMINNDPVKQNQASLQRSEAVESSVMHSDVVQTDTNAPQSQTSQVQPVQEQPAPATQPETSPAVQEEPFDAQMYGLSLLQEKARQGIAMNADCYTKLMVESSGWNLNQSQVDQAFAKVLTYSSTCAAYAQFKATGSY